MFYQLIVDLARKDETQYSSMNIPRTEGVRAGWRHNYSTDGSILTRTVREEDFWTYSSSAGTYDLQRDSPSSEGTYRL